MKWKTLPKTPKKILAELSEYPLLTRRLLYNRGIKTLSEAKDFFNESSVFPGMEGEDIGKVCDLISEAEKNKLPVLIYGDYDADGVSSAFILWDYLARQRHMKVFV